MCMTPVLVRTVFRYMLNAVVLCLVVLAMFEMVFIKCPCDMVYTSGQFSDVTPVALCRTMTLLPVDPLKFGLGLT